MSITQEQFDSLLTWLGSDRDVAARKYETIRAGLVRVFVSKGFNDAEDLADETINRVIIRLPDIRQNYDGEPTRYFHGVARNIIRETGRRREIASEVSGVWIDPRPTSTTTLHFRTSVARLRKSITCNAIWQAVFY